MADAAEAVVDMVAVRDSEDLDGPVLLVTRAACPAPWTSPARPADRPSPPVILNRGGPSMRPRSDGRRTPLILQAVVEFPGLRSRAGWCAGSGRAGAALESCSRH
ncbi:DUF397 domain-containing protein [Actinomadura sp. LCR2-06]|uniref:DUF397 domain-containing protein n=1 Tax=Actinomadura violacea TaxID=2819934 RepID=A0ABS3SC69_9ACTN|nr:DUF397 domain-containing protein [Actinomadura violacea]